MFCPKCGELSFPNPQGIIKCPNPSCGYNGPIDQNLEIDGQEIDLVNASSTSKASDLKHLKEVIAESEGEGVLMEGAMMCPECDSQRIYVVMIQTRSSDEPETKIGTCADCGHKFREYA